MIIICNNNNNDNNNNNNNNNNDNNNNNNNNNNRKSSLMYKHYNLQHNSECLNASLSNFTPARNVAANLIASLKKCYIFACVNQH